MTPDASSSQQPSSKVLQLQELAAQLGDLLLPTDNDVFLLDREPPRFHSPPNR